jgi:spore maturation protein SpmB
MIYASLGLDWSQYAKGLNDAAKSTQSAFSNITKSLASGDIKGAISGMGSALSAIPAPLVAVAAGAAIAGIAMKGMWDAMTRAKEMNILAEQSGMTATQFSVLSKVFGRVGIDAEQLPGVMSKMAASMQEIGDPASKAAQALAKMGLSSQDLVGKNQYEQFKLIAGGIDGMTNSTEKMNAARAIFGKSGAQLLPGMKAGAIDKAEAKGSPVAQIAEDMGGAFAKFQGTVNALKINVGDFFMGMASRAIPALQTVVDGMTNLTSTLVDAGKAFGDSISFWVNYFQNFGTTGDLIYNTLKLAFANAVNYLSQEFDVLMAKAGAELKATLTLGDVAKAGAEAEQAARAKPLAIDTTAMEANVQGAMDKINASKENQKAAALALKTTTEGGLELPAAKGGGGSMALMDLSSLQKVGGGAALLSGGQDNSPAYQTMRIQEDIRNYIKDLINVVKQGQDNYEITPTSGGMVLTA